VNYAIVVVGRTNRFSPKALNRPDTGPFAQHFLSAFTHGALEELSGFAAHNKNLILVFDGGEDVTPALYGRTNTYSDNNLSRDVHELAVYKAARSFNLPIFAFCRGHQFIAAMEGGVLIQDIHTETGIRHNNPVHDVLVTDNDFYTMFQESPFGEFMVSSTHHQAVGIVPTSAHVIATDLTGKICEGLVYPEFGLTLQCHPEHADWTAPLDWVAANFL
jgi:gamma-glutamyl-gamma-aminobutyrate hydrolase PuuD